MTTVKRTALVTGANRGLGLETCRQLAHRGYRVLLTSRDESGVEAARSLAAETRATVEHRALDVADAGSVAALGERLRGDGESIHVLVNNAGIAMEGFGPDGARRTLDVNFFGAMRVTDVVLPNIPDRGNIVMVSSGL